MATVTTYDAMGILYRSGQAAELEWSPLKPRHPKRKALRCDFTVVFNHQDIFTSSTFVDALRAHRERKGSHLIAIADDGRVYRARNVRGVFIGWSEK